MTDTAGSPGGSPDTRRPTLQDRAEWLAFRAAVAGCLALGWPRDLRAAERLGRTVGRLAGPRSAVAMDNLRHAFPERDEAWIRHTLTLTYEHLAREMIATLRFREMSVEEIQARAPVDGLEALERTLAAGSGAVVVSAHFGNWEAGLHGVSSRGVPSDVVVKKQRNPLFDALINESRSRFGVGVIDRARASRGALRALRRGRAVFFVADQNAGPGGVFVPFFGRLASTHRGPALLALRAEVPLYMVSGRRIADGRYRVHMVELTTERSGEPDEVVHRLTRDFTAWIEAEIRAAPEQYFWLHRRWKTRPAEEQPSD